MNTKNEQLRVFALFNAKAFTKLVGPIFALAALLLAGKPAFAQGRFGDARQMAVTAENLFGFSSQSLEVHRPGPPGPGDYTDTTTRMGLLFASHQGGVVPSGVRVGVHYFIIPSLSLGGTIGFESRDGSRSVQNPQGVTVSESKQSETSFLFVPKVGYALMLSDMLGFWFRGGLGYASDTVHPNPVQPDHDSMHFWLASAEALFVVTPLPHFGFYVGPGAELSFSGSYEETAVNGAGVTTSTSYSAHYRRFALDTGLIGHFGL